MASFPSSKQASLSSSSTSHHGHLARQLALKTVKAMVRNDWTECNDNTNHFWSQTRFDRYLHHLTEGRQFPCNQKQNKETEKIQASTGQKTTSQRKGCTALSDHFKKPIFFFFFFFLWGYRGVIHPPLHDEGTEQIWFEPEQRPRKRVSKRSVHGKQSPRGASKTFWRQDDQPWWQGRSCHDTCVSPFKTRRTASVTL